MKKIISDCSTAASNAEAIPEVEALKAAYVPPTPASTKEQLFETTYLQDFYDRMGVCPGHGLSGPVNALPG